MLCRRALLLLPDSAEPFFSVVSLRPHSRENCALRTCYIFRTSLQNGCNSLQI